ncbi:MAG: septal ring lytic transglycosylase RlpA family protein [Methylotenera sp.]|nr:septal ring lytic transglycosylase RlpA family protein [Methylotenera sp.]MSP99004.1 septal ring lytic transglycosylase RlpA family protein [Methylotenera sp.]
MKKIALIISISLLAACAGNSFYTPAVKVPPASSSSTPSSKDGVGTKPGAGGYYLDDGPGESSPANIDSIPNAILKTEQPSTRANKPYMALGQQYTPMTSYAPYKKQGVASWYGKRYHGKKTSIGEIYNMYAMSAAHTTLPIPSYAKVTNPANGRFVIVRINDRGPFKGGRLIDLSYVAAYQLRLVDTGSGLVEVETIDTSAEAMRAAALLANATQENVAPVVQALPTELATTATPAKTTTALSATAIEAAGTPYYLQVGAFKNKIYGDILQKRIQDLGVVENVSVANVYNNGLYRVKLGPYASKEEAESSAAKIRSQLGVTALVTNH